MEKSEQLRSEKQSENIKFSHRYDKLKILQLFPGVSFFLTVSVFTQANAGGSCAAVAFLLFVTIINSYLSKWRWLLVDIYRATKRRDKYPPLTTDNVVNSCFSIY